MTELRGVIGLTGIAVAYTFVLGHRPALWSWLWWLLVVILIIAAMMVVKSLQRGQEAIDLVRIYRLRALRGMDDATDKIGTVDKADRHYHAGRAAALSDALDWLGVDYDER